MIVGLLYSFLCLLLASRSLGDSEKGYTIRFLLLTTQRSGSHFFRDTFTQQKGVYFWDELCFPVLYGTALKVYGSCLDKVSFALALPSHPITYPSKHELQLFLDNPRHKHIYETSKRTNCEAYQSASARDCYLNFINQEASAVGGIVHQDQGWRNIEWMRDLGKIMRLNHDQYGIDFRVFLLHRTNLVAHSLALQNTLEINPDRLSVVRTVDLKSVARIYGSARRVYYDTIAFLAKQRFAAVYVTYERLLSPLSVSTFEELFRFANISMVSPVVLTAETKHHTNGTYNYIENLADVIRDLLANDEDGQHQHVIVGSNDTSNAPVTVAATLKLCMLFDNCVVQPPPFCKDIPCFV
ncbi:hypothetical protein EON65_41140 [archaeon]|nr:MAG: hypothetical protein EON65_41140 [archaeon]